MSGVDPRIGAEAMRRTARLHRQFAEDNRSRASCLRKAGHDSLATNYDQAADAHERCADRADGWDDAPEATP